MALASCHRASLNFPSAAGRAVITLPALGRISRLTLHNSALGWFGVHKRCAIFCHVSCVAQNRTQHKKITDHPEETQHGSVGFSVCCKKEKRAKIKFYSLPVMLLRWTFYSRCNMLHRRCCLSPRKQQSCAPPPFKKSAFSSRRLKFYFYIC